MNDGDGDVYGYQTVSYDRDDDDRAALRDLVATIGLEARPLQATDMRIARAVRFSGFLIARAEMSRARLVWARSGRTEQHRHLFVFVHRGSLHASGIGRIDAQGCGIVYPGKSEIELAASADTDLTIFGCELQAVHSGALTNDRVHLQPDSPVFRASLAFLTGVLTAPSQPRVQSAQILRRMTADVAVALLAEVSSDPMERSGRLVLQIVEANFANPLFTVNELCREARMSRRTLERVCAAAGFAPSDAIRARRIQQARNLLATHDESRPRALWRRSGFASNDAMHRAFVHYYGKTMRELLADVRNVGAANQIDAPSRAAAA